MRGWGLSGWVGGKGCGAPQCRPGSVSAVGQGSRAAPPAASARCSGAARAAPCPRRLSREQARHGNQPRYGNKPDMAGHRAAQAADGPRLAGAWCSGLRHGLALKGASGARARGRLGPACLGHAAGPACSTAQRAGPSRVAERREARSITEGDAAAAYCDFVYSSHSTCSGFGRGHGWGAGRGQGSGFG